jgi:7-alpha-hydroxysteroid dehydrogenase
VVINGRDEAIVADAEASMRAEGLAVASVPGTMGDPGVAAAMVHAAHGHFGRLDLLVNTVGGTRYNGPPLEMSRANLLDTVELNAWTSLELLQEAMRAGLADDGGGSVVFISSGTVNKTTASMASYAAGKSALNALTRTLAKEVGPLGVRLNGVAPGLTKTSATRGMWEADDGASAGSNLLLGRLTEADDIAAAAVFLLSPEAKAITGVVIDVDGGNHLQSGGWSPMAPKAAG